MCVESLLERINGLTTVDEDYKVIIEKFCNKKENAFSIMYFLTNTNIEKNKIYTVFHVLLDLNIIGMKEYSKCPHCMNLQAINNDDLIKCNRCKKEYYINYVIEKFYLKEY
ncbi:hypothetical protein [Clostridium perfringens]|uniref:hypothetical protein n=1 Tax=Clostridium perfringens TaxID=1502 RepID=UPI001CCC0266|nr:hypothetical protein [Clostridium perfringens]MDH2460380.1 hypothetical protein [Clostridium perfringens]UBK44881.1 hypothetical protein KLF34_05035 [Clostridium perfringens]